METILLESSLTAAPEPSETNSNHHFADLRGVLWRIDLGILPSSPSSIDDLRRVTADSRRRYAAMRRHLLVDPHVPKDGSSSPDFVMDNPLSQNPDSMWGRFFRNAELERMVDQDLSRLYPEHGSYFQTPGCQGMLRRILLLWCLRHPKYGYQQGMHELLAPLLYVLHIDVEHLSEVRELYEEHFNDKFDGFSFHESRLMYNFDFKKYSDFTEDGVGSKKSPVKGNSLHELDPNIKDVILLSDAYGAEGELGTVVSEKFMEHDAYCMFDALMNGAGGTVALAHFFNSSPFCTSQSGVSPVIEASYALYHLLSIIDSSLHSHLVEIGVEPQYFALRWLRVLFGREFALQDLLIIWDEIFASDNTRLNKFTNNDAESSSGVLTSSRGAFISAFSVSMILHLRSSLLATENATSCLKRLLNFPEDINLRKLIEKAKSLQTLAVDSNSSIPLPINDGSYDQNKSTVAKHHRVSSDSVSPKTLNLLPESYWEEKWRVLHKEQENKEDIPKKQVQNRIKGWSQKVRLHLSRTESAPSPSRDSRKMQVKPSVRRSLLEDLARQLGSDVDIDVLSKEEQKDPLKEDVHHGIHNNSSCTGEDRCLSGNLSSEENSSIYSDAPSPKDEANDLENQSESCVSNISIEDVTEPYNGESVRADSEDLCIPLSSSPKTFHSGQDGKDIEKSLIDLKEQKVQSGKFQWFWKFGWRAGEETSEKGHSVVATNASTGGYSQGEVANLSTANPFNTSSTISKEEAVDKNVFTLRNLGQSMLENIQVIESAFQQDQGQVRSMENFSKNVLVGKGQVTAMTALKELRKISNLLSEM